MMDSTPAAEPKLFFPRVATPPLENLKVTVRRPPEPTAAEIRELWRKRLWVASPSRPRATGEAIASGDAVQLDVVALSEDRTSTFRLHNAQWMELRTEDDPSGLAAALIGKPVGWIGEVETKGPNPVVAVRILGARQVTMSETPSSGQLAKMGLGLTEAQVVKTLASELASKRALEFKTRLEDAVLDALMSQARFPPLDSLTDLEITRRWSISKEGQEARARGNEEDQLRSLRGWLKHAPLRAKVERLVRISLCLRAVAEQDHVPLGAKDIEELLQAHAERAGVSVDRLRGMDDPTLTEGLLAATWHIALVSYLCGRARVSIEEPPSPGADARSGSASIRLWS